MYLTFQYFWKAISNSVLCQIWCLQNVPFIFYKGGEMVKLSEIAFILKQVNELDASKNVLLKRVLILTVIIFKTIDELRQKKQIKTIFRISYTKLVTYAKLSLQAHSSIAPWIS